MVAILNETIKIKNVLFYFPSLLIAVLLSWPLSISADQAQYFYDELNRLIGVIDGQGNIASYEYDAVGNLLSISNSPVATPSIASVTPDPIEAGTTMPITIVGTGLLLPTVTVSNPDIQVGLIASTTPTTIDTSFTIPNPTAFGANTLTVTAPGGADSTTFTINQPIPIITSLSSSVGPPGATISLIGTDNPWKPSPLP